MSKLHSDAINCFTENRNRLDFAGQPEQWNLYQGLALLSHGNEADLSEIKVLLKKVLQELQKRK